MTEAEIRDLIASNIECLESGLTLFDKEKYIPNELGTRSFVDLYARDRHGNHVIVEVKKSDAVARTAIHEVHKYVEGVKSHFKARDHEIRVIVASTHWGELIVPFSRFVSDSSMNIIGLKLDVDTGRQEVNAFPVQMLEISSGRLIAPWHDFNWYLDEKSLRDGIVSIHASCQKKGIEDYLVLTYEANSPQYSEHQMGVRQTLSSFSGREVTSIEDLELPEYQFAVYVAYQQLSKNEYLAVIANDKSALGEANELLEDLEGEEALQYLHDSAIAIDPRPDFDYYEIGYPAKFRDRFLTGDDFQLRSIDRRGAFKRNELLSDDVLLSEIAGETGVTGQNLSCEVSVSNRGQMAALRDDVRNCLEANPIWRAHILQHFDQIEVEFPDSELEVQIYTPSTGVLTLFYSTTRDEGQDYVPSYSVAVKNPDLRRLYYGTPCPSGSPESLDTIVSQFYDGDLAGLLLTMTWGGFEHRDVDIMEALGLAYRSFRCDLDDTGLATTLALRDDRWRPCEPTPPYSQYAQYLEENSDLIYEIIDTIGSRVKGKIVEISRDEGD